MNDKIGQLAFPKDQGGGFPSERPYSESTAEVMDAEVLIMVTEAYNRTLALMEEHKESVIKVAELLMKEETISHTDVARLIGDRKFSAGQEYDEYLVHVSHYCSVCVGLDPLLIFGPLYDAIMHVCSFLRYFVAYIICATSSSYSSYIMVHMGSFNIIVL